GSVSCPTLRSEPYSGENLDAQLDDQVRHFLTAGGCRPDIGKSVVHLSRVFLWFGADFVRPHRMPTLWPVRSSQTLAALKRWMDPDTASWIESVNPDVEFQRYDWGLRCTVR
ncbi:MAG TPA: hypothetical protein VE569_10370, partial [Acidimicrobiia bacterium]|nr:hypothetical protein [Acidimicrobiia bacterium]